MYATSKGPRPQLRKREIKGERCTKQLVYSSIFNVELQSYIYRRLALMSLTHMTQDNWLVNSTLALWIKSCVKWATCAQILTNSS